MTDEKIIEYVMDSPENTNPSVLDSMLKSNKVQPDWNQNDSTANDYIKNRPFYEEVTEVVMLSETRFEVGEIPKILLSESFPYTFEVGKDYIVTLDGESRTYTAIEFELGRMLTNTSLDDATSGNGWIILAVGGQVGLQTLDPSLAGTHTIKIGYPTTTTHKIDSKYIDESSIASSIAPSIVSSIDLSSKMDKTNPVCEGSFSLNRNEGNGIGEFSFAEGKNATASGQYSHAEGFQTTASGESSHAEGENTTASSYYSHAEGYNTTASGTNSHAEGSNTTASGQYSHAEGFQTITASRYQHVQGMYNVEDSNNVYAHIVGGGSYNQRKNIHTVDWSGNAWYDGNVEGKALIIASSTAGSTKRFKVTVNDAGTLTATEVTS